MKCAIGGTALGSVSESGCSEISEFVYSVDTVNSLYVFIKGVNLKSGSVTMAT